MALALTPDIKQLVNGALESGNPMMLAVVTPDHRPRLSFRGSTQVYSDDALCLWIRHASGDTLDAIRANPNVAMMYRSSTVPVLQFQGRARIVSDEAERNRVFEKAPVREQDADRERKGLAIIIDLDKVDGVLITGPSERRPVQLAR